jgi:hypothetical protein
MKQYPVMDSDGHLGSNDIWNIPDNVDEVRGVMKHQGPWHIPVSYRALAMDRHGRVFGMRIMGRIRECGYDLEGRVKIEGKSYRAFTSSKLFTRANGSLCSVAIIYVCGTPDMLYRDPIDVWSSAIRDGHETPDAEYRAYIRGISSRYHYERDGMYHTLARYCTVLDNIASPDYADNKCARERWAKESEELRALLAAPMHW